MGPSLVTSQDLINKPLRSEQSSKGYVEGVVEEDKG